MSTKSKDTSFDEIDIYSVLESRAKFVRRTNIALITLLILAATLVATLIIGYKDNQKNWISDIINTPIFNKADIQPGDLVFFKTNATEDGKRSGLYLGKDSEAKNHIDTSAYVRKVFDEQFGLHTNKEKSQSEKIADSIATVLLTFSLIIFVGFIMRAVLVFIRYYMQLGTDFENQRLAYLICKKEGIDFSKTLQDLRSSEINFEKTPQLPQEKIILGVIDALKKIDSSKYPPPSKT